MFSSIFLPWQPFIFAPMSNSNKKKLMKPRWAQKRVAISNDNYSLTVQTGASYPCSSYILTNSLRLKETIRLLSWHWHWRSGILTHSLLHLTVPWDAPLWLLRQEGWYLSTSTLLGQLLVLCNCEDWSLALENPISHPSIGCAPGQRATRETQWKSLSWFVVQI